MKLLLTMLSTSRVSTSGHPTFMTSSWGTSRCTAKLGKWSAPKWLKTASKTKISFSAELTGKSISLDFKRSSKALMKPIIRKARANLWTRKFTRSFSGTKTTRDSCSRFSSMTNWIWLRKTTLPNLISNQTKPKTCSRNQFPSASRESAERRAKSWWMALTTQSPTPLLPSRRN